MGRRGTPNSKLHYWVLGPAKGVAKTTRVGHRQEQNHLASVSFCCTFLSMQPFAAHPTTKTKKTPQEMPRLTPFCRLFGDQPNRQVVELWIFLTRREAEELSGD